MIRSRFIMNSNYARQIGGNNHKDREANDYYATPPRAINDLLSKVELNNHIWEPACGGGHLSQRLSELGYQVYSTDIVDRGYSNFNQQLDFLTCTKSFNGDIVTNPPYKLANQFVLKALDLLPSGGKLCLFLKIQFLEGQQRLRNIYSLGELKNVFVYSKRITSAKNGDFEKYHASSFCHAWFVWEKGYHSKPTLDWID